MYSQISVSAIDSFRLTEQHFVNKQLFANISYKIIRNDDEV